MSRALTVVVALCFLCYAQLYSQSIQLSFAGDTVYATSDKSEEYVSVTVKNVSSNTINVKVSRISETLTSGHETYFCWEQCYPPTSSNSSGTITILPGDSSKNFTGHVVTNGYEGVSEAVFLFSNEDEANDTASVRLIFDVEAPSGIKNIQKQNGINISTALINNCINIDLSSPLPQASISIYNISGALVFKKVYPQAIESFKIPIESFPIGIYTVQLTSQAACFAQKIIVSH